MRFSERGFTADPNYDKLGSDNAKSTGDFSILSGSKQRNVHEQGDQYSHLKCHENKQTSVETDVTDDYSHLNSC